MNRLILQFTAQLHIAAYSPDSIHSHRLDIIRFQRWLETRELRDEANLAQLERTDVKAYQAFLARSLKPRSINRHLSSLRLFFTFLEKSGLIFLNPMDGVVFPRILPSLPQLLLPGEVNALLAAPQDSHYLGLRDRTMLELLYSSGFKVHELIALEVSSLHLELGFLKVEGKRARMVPLTDHAVALLRRYLSEGRPGRLLHPEAPWLFPSRNGTRITRVGVWKLIKKYARQAKIEKNFNPRALRHAFAMHLILAGMDLEEIRFLFGYRQLEATAPYAHVNTPDFQQVYRAWHPSSTDEEG